MGCSHGQNLLGIEPGWTVWIGNGGAGLVTYMEAVSFSFSFFLS